MPRIFLREICEHCNHYRYKDSDYGRLGADHYTCNKNVFGSTRDSDWYEKAKKCKQFVTRFTLSQETLERIGRK